MESISSNNLEDSTYPEFLGQRYSSIEKIGQGGMGAVYKAFDNTLLKNVVIKVVIPKQEFEKQAVSFQKEARALSRLKNDNLVSVYDFGMGDTSALYMVLEFLDGKSLAQLIEERGRLSPEDCLPIFIQIANGLMHAHSNAVIHRDLKPENIIAGKNESGELLVKIIDFGIAKIEDGEKTSTDPNNFKGSPLYVAPEVISGLNAQEACDIYSFGCMMFKTLTGKAPYESESVLVTLEKHRNEKIPSVKDYSPNCPDDLAELVKKCMMKEPQNRYSSTKELKDELETIYQGRVEEGINTPPVIEFDESNINKDSNSIKVVFGLVIVLITGIVGLVVFSIFTDKRADLPVETRPIKQKPSPFKEPHYGVKDPFKVNRIYGKLAWHAKYVGCSEEELAKILIKKKPLDISIMYSPIHGTMFNKFTHWPMRTLRLESSEITDEGLNYICKIKTIRNLDLTATNITDKGLPTINELPNLRHLEISVCPGISETGVIDLLKSNKTINSIKIKRLKLTDIVIPYLVSRKMETIEIANNKISDKGIFKLSKIPTLKEIDISGNVDVSQNTFLAFAKQKKITKLECRDLPKVSKEVIAKYKKIYKQEGKIFHSNY